MFAVVPLSGIDSDYQASTSSHKEGANRRAASQSCTRTPTPKFTHRSRTETRYCGEMPDRDPHTVRIRCDKCLSRLSVTDTSSGGRLIAVSSLGSSVEHSAKALEVFLPPPATLLKCPACSSEVDPFSLRRWQN